MRRLLWLALVWAAPSFAQAPFDVTLTLPLPQGPTPDACRLYLDGVAVPPDQACGSPVVYPGLLPDFGAFDLTYTAILNGVESGQSPIATVTVTALATPTTPDLPPGDIVVDCGSVPCDVIVTFNGTPDPPQGEHAYFQDLVQRPDVFFARAYSTAGGQSAAAIQAEIDGDRQGGEPDPVNVYDASLDAARLQFLANEGDIGQQRIAFPQVKTSGNVFFTWEVRWDQYWASTQEKSTRDGISTHKSIQIRSLPDFDLHVEVRTLYRDLDEMDIDEPVPVGVVGFVDIREYLGSSDTLWPIQTVYPIPPEQWVRYWLWLDWDADTISLWIDDATQPLAVIYDRAIDGGGQPLDGGQRFDFEFDSSQDRSGPETFIWVRNLVALEDLSGFSEAQALVMSGAV